MNTSLHSDRGPATGEMLPLSPPAKAAEIDTQMATKKKPRSYLPILGSMMPSAPAFQTDTSLSKKAVQDYLRTKDIRIFTGTP